MLLPVEIARFTRTEPARLCCSNPRLAADRCYLLRRPAESGLSSDRTKLPAVIRHGLREAETLLGLPAQCNPFRAFPPEGRSSGQEPDLSDPIHFWAALSIFSLPWC